MSGRKVFDSEGFKNIYKNKKAIGFQFRFKLQYYRSITLSIIREILVNIDGEDVKREDIRLIVNGEKFSLEDCRTVISPLFRWEFGEFIGVEVQKEGGLSAGKHHMSVLQHIAPSYMPFPVKKAAEIDFEIRSGEGDYE